MGSVAVDSVIIALVSYTISLSMAILFAQELNYEVNANQELLAQGLGNIVGSFFSCLPFSASLSRSSIQKSVGGKTQMASLIACALLVVVLLWIGPFFETLPKCVLASIIFVAFKGMLMQAGQFIRFWNMSKVDGFVWLLTFLSSVLVDIDIGLLVGIVISLAIIFVQGIKPYTCLLGSVPKTDLYLDINRYKGAVELPGIKIFHYCGGLNFASRTYFKTTLYRSIGVNPQKELDRRDKLAKLKNKKLSDKEVENNNSIQNKVNSAPPLITCVIIDFSALSFIDPSGVTAVQQLSEEFKKIDIPIYVAGCSGPVYEKFTKCAAIDDKQYTFLRFFPTVHDAVQSANIILTISYDMHSPNIEIIRL